MQIPLFLKLNVLHLVLLPSEQLDCGAAVMHVTACHRAPLQVHVWSQLQPLLGCTSWECPTSCDQALKPLYRATTSTAPQRLAEAVVKPAPQLPGSLLLIPVHPSPGGQC